MTHVEGAAEMLSIDYLVPGYDCAVDAIPGGTEMARVLGESTEEGNLPARTAALIRVAVAQRAGGPYARWAMSRLAAREWIGAEDIFFATMGTSRDPIESVIVKAAVRMTANAGRTRPVDFDALAHLLGAPRATEVVAQVALALLACEALASIAPSTGTAERSRPEA
jgi:hypothetical protein